MLVTLKEILRVANENQFAVPAFNISSYAMFRGLMDEAEICHAPVIIAIHPDELHHIGSDIITSIRSRALCSQVPVCIHLDHGSSYDQVLSAIKAGFTSVMIDGSTLSFKDNIEICKKVCEAAHAVNISVEGELGTIGSTNPEVVNIQKISYTNPQDAKDFVYLTGVDALAVAIGTCHGLYPAGFQPELKLDLLKLIKEAVNVPIVLHGGSNNPDEEIRQSVNLGVSKINISSDIKAAFYKKMREVLKNESLREPNEIEPPCINALRKVVREKIYLFNDNNKSNLYFKFS